MLKTLHFHIHEVAPYINWLYFFHTWGFPSRLASIAKVHGCEACRINWLTSFAPEDRIRAQQAMKLYDEAQELLREADQTIMTHALIGLFACHAEDEDIRVRTLEGDLSLPFLRQQKPGSDGLCLCLSDFIRPAEKGEDTVGIFACSVDHALEEGEPEDDYRHLLHQTLADRLAEATAECMHELVRKKLWGYAPDEHLTIDEMFNEQYQGKRPAVGYPSIPDQSINFLLDKLLDFSSIGITLTESGAMRPHASTSGIMLSHPQCRHFSVGEVEEDQLHDYARRRGMAVEEMRRFLV